MSDSTDIQQVTATVNRVLREQVGVYGFREAGVTIGLDHDGDEVLFVDAHYDLTNEAVPPRAFFGLTRAVRDALAEQGEGRFPYIRNHFHADQRVAV